MRWRYWMMTGLVLAFLGNDLSATGIIFGKRKKSESVPAAKRVPELIETIRASRNDHDREDAIEELRDFDHKAFPEIVDVLIDTLLNDPDTTVRVEAARSLGRLRPVTRKAGWALERALDKDGSMRVRLQSRSALLQYNWNGYKKMRDKPYQPESEEPPLAKPLEKAPPIIDTNKPPEPKPIPVPPLTPPSQPATVPEVPQPLPKGPALIPPPKSGGAQELPRLDPKPPVPY